MSEFPDVAIIIKRRKVTAAKTPSSLDKTGKFQ